MMERSRAIAALQAMGIVLFMCLAYWVGFVSGQGDVRKHTVVRLIGDGDVFFGECFRVPDLEGFYNLATWAKLCATDSRREEAGR